MISDKNEIVAMLVHEKKAVSEQVASLKKEIIQAQKATKAVKDSNRQMEDNVVKLTDLVLQKADRNHHLERDTALLKRDVKALSLDCEDLR